MAQISDFRDIRTLFIWSLVLIGLLLIGYAIVSWLRKRLHQADEPASTGFTLEDLRELHRSGKLNDEQYERARARLAGGLLKSDAKKEKAG